VQQLLECKKAECEAYFESVVKVAKKVMRKRENDGKLSFYLLSLQQKSVQPKTSTFGIQNMALLLLPMYLVLLTFLNPPQKLQAPLLSLESLLLFPFLAVAGLLAVAGVPALVGVPTVA
jgi:hypothetical protein